MFPTLWKIPYNFVLKGEKILSTWLPLPLHTLISELLKEKRAVTDVELFEVIRKKYRNIGFRELKKALMKMEILGKIHVSTITKGSMWVELIKP